LKGVGHDTGRKGAARSQIPFRRWEEWERSRLRKLKRDERRQREMMQAFPGGYQAQRGDFDGQSGSSDTLSLASSEDDVWGVIGGYNENSSVNIPPPTPHTIAANPDMMASTTTLGDDDMEALLDAGFDDSPSRPSSNRYSRSRPPTLPSTPRYQLTDSLMAPSHDFQAYPPRTGSPGSRQPPPPRERVISPTSPFVPVHGASSSATPWQTHAKKRSGGRPTPGSGGSGGSYGPLGPLDPGSRI